MKSGSEDSTLKARIDPLRFMNTWVGLLCLRMALTLAFVTKIPIPCSELLTECLLLLLVLLVTSLVCGAVKIKKSKWFRTSAQMVKQGRSRVRKYTRSDIALVTFMHTSWSR